MRLSCLQENLVRGLGTVSRAVGNRSVLPITTHVLLTTDNSRLKLAATNLEIAISFWVGAKIEEEGSIAIPAALLTDFVSSLPKDKIEMGTVSGTLTMELKCANFEARISGQSADEFPPIPRIGEGVTSQVDANLLRGAIDQVIFAAATDESRPVLTGVYTRFSNDTVTLVAADGFRLAVYTIPLAQSASEDVGIIIPARSFRELGRLLRDQEDPVDVTINPQRSQVLFRLKNAEMVSQLIQGTFPNYSQLIPQSYNTRAVINVAEFLRAIKSASVFARDGGGIIRLIITPGNELSAGKMTISSQAEEVGDDVGEVSAVVEGSEAKIAFNSKYLMDVLSAISDEQVALETTDPSSPGVFRPLEGDEWVQVVMPMFVQW